MLLVQDDGRSFARFDTDRFRLGQLFDSDGSAVIVHQGRDNYANIPERYGGPDEETLKTGDAGARFACGVVPRGRGGPLPRCLPKGPPPNSTLQ